MANVRMVRGTQEKYDELPSKDNNAVYFLTDSQTIYLGSTKMSTDAEVEWEDIEAQRQAALLRSLPVVQNEPEEEEETTPGFIIIDNMSDEDTSSIPPIIVDDEIERTFTIVDSGENTAVPESNIIDSVNTRQYNGEPIIID